MLHAAETWAMKVDTLNRLRRNDRAMIRWICNVRAKDEVSSDSLLTKLGIQDLDVVLRTSRMRWFGHVEHSTGWIAEVRFLFPLFVNNGLFMNFRLKVLPKRFKM